MEGFFEAQSIVLIGVSDSPTNLGRNMARNLTTHNYQGRFYLVGHRGGAVLGHKIHASVKEVPDSLDLAVLLIPAAIVPQTLRDCGDVGIKRVVVETGGFSELAEDRKSLEDEIDTILQEYGMRMIGPNCVGIINAHRGLAVPFVPFTDEIPQGPVSVIAQSGGVGMSTLHSLLHNNMGLHCFASVGNKLNVNEVDLMEYFIREPRTQIIYTYLESIGDGRRLMRTALESEKPIVVFKANKTEAGSSIARSHSAALSSNDKVVDAALKQCGIIRVETTTEGMDVLKGLSLPPMSGRRLAIISRSGGHAVIAADAVEEYGFTLPPIPESLLAMTAEYSRAGVIRLQNPLDLGDVFDLSLYRQLAESVLKGDDMDGLLFIHHYRPAWDAEPSRTFIRNLADFSRNYRKPVAICVCTSGSELQIVRKQVDFPIFDEPSAAMMALDLNRRRATDHVFLPIASEKPRGIGHEKLVAEREPFPGGAMSPSILGRLLQDYGIPVVPWATAASEAEAVEAARRLGFPVVLKTAEPEVVHKSDVGGVVLGLHSEEEVKDAYGRISSLGPKVLLQKMAESGLEWLVGGRHDFDFGPVVVTGLGGIYVEVFKETAIRVGPVGHAEAMRMIGECKGARLLEGVRGASPLAGDALGDVIEKVSWLLHDHPEIQELDLNPLRVYPRGVLALDWRAAVDGRNR